MKVTQTELDELDRLEKQAAGAFSIPDSDIDQWNKDKADRAAKLKAKAKTKNKSLDYHRFKKSAF